MSADRKRLARLHRLEHIRAVARQTAASEAAEAESTLAQLLALAERTLALASGYARPGDHGDAAGLRRQAQFHAGLRDVEIATRLDAERARAMADAKLTALGQAERRRAAAETRAADHARAMARAAQRPVLDSRRSTGTPLE